MRIVATPDNFVEGMGMLRKLALESAGAKSFGKLKINAVSGGAAGSLDRKNGILFNPPNLSDWKGKPIRKAIATALGIGIKKVFVENDTALVGLGEATSGAGKKYKIVAYITVSTGVNGIRVVDGALDRSAFGFEIGHQIVGATERDTLESFVGAAALSQKYKMPASEIKDKKVWDEAHRRLAYGLHNMILHWSPDVIVMGGGQVRSGDISIERVARELKRIHHIFSQLPEIKKAALGDLGGLYGAIVFLRQQIRK